MTDKINSFDVDAIIPCTNPFPALNTEPRVEYVTELYIDAKFIVTAAGAADALEARLHRMISLLIADHPDATIDARVTQSTASRYDTNPF